MDDSGFAGLRDARQYTKVLTALGRAGLGRETVDLLREMRRQGLFIHELVHVWQVQTKGEWFLVTRRMPWARYDYSLKPGWPLERYGIEQQAEIVKHAFWLRRGMKIAGVADPAAYEMLVRFPGAES